MLWNGEFYYYLTKTGAAFLKDDQGYEVHRSARFPVALNIQHHEFDLARFWIKFFSDSKKLQIPVLQFWRDHQFIAPIKGKKLIPDGTVALSIRGKTRILFIEMDRSTQTSGLGGKAGAIIVEKLERYQRLQREFRTHPELVFLQPYSMRVVFVCLTEQRMQNLRQVAESMGLTKQCAFTCQPYFLDIASSDKAHVWSYRRANILAAPLFVFPIRPPPASLLS